MLIHSYATFFGGLDASVFQPVCCCDLVAKCLVLLHCGLSLTSGQGAHLHSLQITHNTTAVVH